MKISKFIMLLDILLKICVSAALIIGAATKQQYSYYDFLRWLVMTSFIYFCFSSIIKRQFGIIIFFGMVAILFNPFHKFYFKKQTWHLVDYLVAGIIILTITYDLFYLIKYQRQAPKSI